MIVVSALTITSKLQVPQVLSTFHAEIIPKSYQSYKFARVYNDQQVDVWMGNFNSISTRYLWWNLRKRYSQTCIYQRGSCKGRLRNSNKKYASWWKRSAISSNCLGEHHYTRCQIGLIWENKIPSYKHSESGFTEDIMP